MTKLFWEITPADKKQFVADPAKGSRHNRGCAVDLTLYDLKTGRQVSMPGEYDEMSERSHINYAGGTPEQRRLRDLLRAALEAEGFNVYAPEWEQGTPPGLRVKTAMFFLNWAMGEGPDDEAPTDPIDVAYPNRCAAIWILGCREVDGRDRHPIV